MPRIIRICQRFFCPLNKRLIEFTIYFVEIIQDFKEGLSRIMRLR
jgi:hypothetical protein